MILQVFLLSYILLACSSLRIGRLHEQFSRRLIENRNEEEHEVDNVFLQKVDHFDASNTRTFFQRYAFNDTYLKSDHGRQIVILLIGGEGPLSKKYVEKGFLLHMAKELNALLVALEHRHYGTSLTSFDYDQKELTTLTSQQALADIVTFRWHIRNRFSLEHDEWISVGGSYAGMLSSWARIKFPNFIKASLASSAPVEAKPFFTQYLLNVADALARHSVGGSQQCLDNVDLAFKALDIAYSTQDAFAELETRLSACKPSTTYEDVQDFVSSLIDPFAHSVQYNGESPNASIKKICELMTSGHAPLDMLANVTKHWINVTGEACISIDSKQTLREMKSKYHSNSKSWFYQTCREFGFYQTCEHDNCPFSKLVTEQLFVKYCPEVYGINDHLIRGYNQFTNDYYGAKHPGGTRIIYTHGSLDPWRSLGVKHNNTRSQIYSVIIKDAPHCRDIHITDEPDTQEVTKARQFILHIFKKWFRKL